MIMKPTRARRADAGYVCVLSFQQLLDLLSKDAEIRPAQASSSGWHLLPRTQLYSPAWPLPRAGGAQFGISLARLSSASSGGEWTSKLTQTLGLQD